MREVRLRRRFAAAAAMAALSGCVETPVPSERVPLATRADDPCALRLHDLSGALLLHEARKGALPDKLESVLGLVPGSTPSTLECPESHQPYEYRAEGWTVPGLAGRAVIRDPTPAHAGHRWAVVVLDQRTGKSSSTRVVAVE